MANRLHIEQHDYAIGELLGHLPQPTGQQGELLASRSHLACPDREL
ncbi:hypothetical protein ACWCWQ_12760 [Streptomyces sp. NPDC001571]